MSAERYKDLLEVLTEAINLSARNRIYYDLCDDEDSIEAKKEFQYIAKMEGLPVYIRKIRGIHAFEFIYKAKDDPCNLRLSPEVYRNRILAVLKDAGKPLQKSEIIELGRLKEATWNLRIKELVESGYVRREGERRHATYMITF